MTPELVKRAISILNKVSNILADRSNATETEIHNAKGELEQVLNDIRIEATFRRHSDPKFDGIVYDPRLDHNRLRHQLGQIFECMRDGWWRTLQEISTITRQPEASVSAQLRHLRKPRFGSYIVNRRPRGERAQGLFEYQLLGPDSKIVGREQGPQ